MRFVVFWAVLLFSLPAQAQEAMDGPQGQPGVWLPLEEARVAVLCLGDLQASRAQVGLLGQSLTLADAHTAALTAEVERLGRSLAELERNLADAGAWWRSPFFWGVVGLVVGAGGVVALAVTL